MGRDLTFFEIEFLRHIHISADRGIAYGWMHQVVSMEWDNEVGGSLARLDTAQKEKPWGIGT
jgi:hypothetical protein